MTSARDAPASPRAVSAAQASLAPPTAALLFACASCGAAPAPPQAPAAQVVQVAPLRPTPPDLAPVPEPSTLVVSGRVARPSAVLSRLGAWSQLPMPQADEVGELLTGEAIGPLLDLDHPIDFAVAALGSGARMHGRAGISVALRDGDRARAALADRFKLTPGDGGALLIQGLGRSAHGESRDADDDHAVEDSLACEIAPAYGPVGWRLVCATGGKALSDLAPWLTRTAPRASSPSDARVDVRMQPLRSTLSGQKRLFGSVLASALGSRIGATSAGARELASSACGDLLDFALDLDGLSMDLQLGESGAAATATLKLSTVTSALARVAAAHAAQSGPPPDAFLQLPADADVAFFDRGIDEPDLARGRDLFLQVMGDGLADFGLKDPDRKAILDVLGKMASPVPMVYASGLDPDAVKKTLAAEAALGDTSDAAALAAARGASRQAMLGWRIVEFEEPAGRWLTGLKDLVAALGRPSVVAAYRSTTAGGAPALVRVAPMPKGVSMPAGTVHYVVDLSPPGLAHSIGRASGSVAGPVKPAAGSPVRAGLDVFVVPDGGRTWMGIGGGDAFVASKIAAAIAPAGDKVAGHAELAQAGSVGAGGFITLRALPEAALQVEALLSSRSASAEMADVVEELGHFPRGRVAPIVFSVTARSDATPVPVEVRLNLPHGAIEDLFAAVLRHGGF